MTSLIEKLFGKSKNSQKIQNHPAPAPQPLPLANFENQEVMISGATAPLSPELLATETERLNPPQLIVGCGQSVGLQRDHNEDALFTLTTTLVSDTAQLPFGFYVIADGMGGHQHGEVASSLAVRAISGYVIRKLFMPLFSLRNEPPDESLQEILQESIFEAHRAILKEAGGGGTTVTVAVIMGDQLMIAHVGDSRAYAIYPDGTIKAITRDHSLVKRLEELGQITSAEAAIHPQRNVLYRALGQGEPFEPDITSFPLPRAGFLLLCSDGLWGTVAEKEISDIIKSSSNPEYACQRLVKAANTAGGPDNISVILVRIPV